MSSNFIYGNSSTCTQISPMQVLFTLAPGSNCTEVVSFAPMAVASISGTLVNTDNSLNATAPYAMQSVALNGVGTQAIPTIIWATLGQHACTSGVRGQQQPG